MQASPRTRSSHSGYEQTAHTKGGKCQGVVENSVEPVARTCMVGHTQHNFVPLLPSHMSLNTRAKAPIYGSRLSRPRHHQPWPCTTLMPAELRRNNHNMQSAQIRGRLHRREIAPHTKCSLTPGRVAIMVCMSGAVRMEARVHGEKGREAGCVSSFDALSHSRPCPCSRKNQTAEFSNPCEHVWRHLPKRA